jgi:peptidyl-prolyl cis-trans isomerase-like protein 2
MGFKKHRHSKDKLYIRSTEWAEEFGGFKKQSSLRLFKRLPFDSCCISLAPFENPMCDKKGNCFELLNIVPWLKQYGTNPVTGEKMKGIFLTNLFNLF